MRPDTSPDTSPGADPGASPLPALVEARAAAFGYDGRPVVSGVDLSIVAGDYVGLAGPNGAGKTTLFRGLLGLIPPLSGSVRRTEQVGYVPQRETLDPVYPLTVEEVVEMGGYARLRGFRGPSREDRTETLRALEAVALADRRRRPFASLSGGQRQRALIARALVMRPRVLLLDEPTSGVDERAQGLIFDLLARLRDEQGLAVLLVSHQIARLRRNVHRVLWVEGGRVVPGAPDEVLVPARSEREER